MSQKIKNKKEYVKHQTHKIDENLSLFERVQIEAKTAVPGVGHKRELARGVFALWLSLPNMYKGLPETVIDKLGIEDADTKVLLQIKTQTEFEKVFSVAHGLACGWKKEINLHQPDHALRTKYFFKTLTTNVLGALYRASLTDGDAARVKLWFQIVEDWSEHSRVHYSEGNQVGLSEEEKRQLDELVVKNTR